MRVIHKILPRRRIPCVAAIGTFDGIHRGHEFILGLVRQKARNLGVASLVITFDILPQQFFSKAHYQNRWPSRKPFLGYLTAPEEKAGYLRRLGLDFLWLLETNKKLLELSGRDFIAYILRYFDMRQLVVGDDFRFGYAGQSDINSLRRLALDFGFSLSVVKKKVVEGRIISSSAIRGLIRAGRLPEAEKILGRNFCIAGRVASGKKFGHRLGFPTANIYARDYVVPPSGVYAAAVAVAGMVYPAAVFIKAATKGQFARPALVEAHLINFSKNILRKKIAIIFYKKIRNARCFHTIPALRHAIQKDVSRISSKYSIPPRRYTQLIVS